MESNSTFNFVLLFTFFITSVVLYVQHLRSKGIKREIKKTLTSEWQLEEEIYGQLATAADPKLRKRFPLRRSISGNTYIRDRLPSILHTIMVHEKTIENMWVEVNEEWLDQNKIRLAKLHPSLQWKFITITTMLHAGPQVDELGHPLPYPPKIAKIQLWRHK